MFILKNIYIFCAAITAVHCFLDDHVTDTSRNVSLISLRKYVNETVKMNRRAVLIINSDNILRNSKSKPKTVESLRYEEYAENGNKLNEFMMYTLEDVASFFKTYLNTEVCHGKCKD